MQTITVPAHEWKELNERVEDIYRLLKPKTTQKEWVRTAEFLELTNKDRDQMNYIIKCHPELKRKKAGEGVQINYKLYKQLYLSA